MTYPLLESVPGKGGGLLVLFGVSVVSYATHNTARCGETLATSCAQSAAVPSSTLLLFTIGKCTEREVGLAPFVHSRKDE